MWLKETYPDIDVCTSGDWAFRYTCEVGHLDVVQWLVEIASQPTGVNIHSAREDAFVSACLRKHFEVVEWLTEYGLTIGSPINIHAQDYEALLNGDLKLTKWLLEKYPDIEDRGVKRAFGTFCKKGELGLAKFFMDKFPEICLSSISSVVDTVCAHGHIDILNWLLTFPADDVFPKNSCFDYACDYGHLEIAKILVSKFPDIDVHFQDDCVFRNISRKGNIKMIRWFLDTYPETQVIAC
jgi:hypothetical protein